MLMVCLIGVVYTLLLIFNKKLCDMSFVLLSKIRQWQAYYENMQEGKARKHNRM